MDLFGPIFLLLTSLVVTIHSLPDGLEMKSLPDASVFEMTPPKEFTDLFKPDDSKNLINPMKSPFLNENSSHNLSDLTKFLPDPSVFEMIPPKEFSNLFGLKEKENVNASKDVEQLDSKKELSHFEVSNVPGPSDSNVVHMNSSKESIDSTTSDTDNLNRPMKEFFSKVSNMPGEKKIPDPKVFEMKPPKEFIDLFQFRDKKIFVNQKENIKSTSGDVVTTFPDEKSDPSVFEMKPTNGYFNLFQFKLKEESDKSKKESSSDVVQSHSLTPEKKTLPDENVFEMKHLQEFTNLIHSKENEESKKPLKWPSWSFGMNNYGGETKFPDLFYLPGLQPEENTKIEKHTQPNISPKQQDVHWNEHTFESHSYYHHSPPGNQEFKPFNVVTSNKELPGFQNILNKKKDDNDKEVSNKDDLKTIKHTKTEILKFPNDKTDKLSDTTKGKTTDIVLAKSSAEESFDAPSKEKGESSNKISDAIIFLEDDILVKKDKEVKPVEFKSNEKVSLVNKPEHLHESPPKISVLGNSIFVPVQLMPSPQSQRYGFGNIVFLSTLYPPRNYGLPLPMLNVQMPSQDYGFEYTNQPNHQSSHSSEVKPDALALSGNVVQDLSSNNAQSIYDLIQTPSVKPNDAIISSIEHSSKHPSSSHVAAMILPSKTVPQTRSIISGNNMVINNGDKLANVDQNINGTPVPFSYNFPSHGESNQENVVVNARPESNLNQGNIPNSPPVIGQPVNYPAFGTYGNMLSQNNYPENHKPAIINQGNVPVITPNLGQSSNYPAFVSNSNNMVSQNNKYPQNQQPVFVNVPYGFNGVPLNYVMANGALLNGKMANTQNYQPNLGQGVVVPSPMVGGYTQNNLYALVPILNKPEPYFNNNVNGNGYHQVSGQVYNLVPAQNNALLTTKDEDDL